MAVSPLPDGLYAIADSAFGDPVALGLAFASAGCRVVQLRAKDWSDEAIVRAARALREPRRARGCLLVINDRVDVAVAVRADGVHVGQGDAAVRAARSRLGPDALVGLSTHDVEQVRAANDVPDGPDYLGFGPVFRTDTTKASWEARGTVALAEAIATSRVPVVAIGGITSDNLPVVQAAGARHWAMISEISRLVTVGESLCHLMSSRAILECS